MSLKLLQAVAQHANYLKMVKRCADSGGSNCKCVSHRECTFGRWYYGEGTTEVESLNNAEVTKLWHEIEDAHIRFHADSMHLQQQVLSQTDVHDTAIATDIAEHETKMMQSSTILVNRVLSLDKTLSEIG